MNWVLMAVAGFAAGVAAAMGLGGGFVLLVALTLTGTAQREAQWINLVFFLPVAALALFLHRKNGLLIGMGTAQCLQNLVGLILDAQAHAIEAGRAQLVQRHGVDRFRVGLKGHLTLPVHIEPLTDFRQNSFQAVGAKKAGLIDQ